MLGTTALGVFGPSSASTGLDLTACAMWHSPTLRPDMIAQLIPRKLFRAMISRVSRNPARNNSSEMSWRNDKIQKGLEVCYCLWGCHPDPRLGPILGPSRSHPGSEGVPSRFAMCFVLQRFGPIQVPRWGPSRPVLVPSCSRAFLTGSGLDGPKQTSWPLPKNG